jgi:hypothetical protein
MCVLITAKDVASLHSTLVQSPLFLNRIKIKSPNRQQCEQVLLHFFDLKDSFHNNQKTGIYVGCKLK